MAYFDSILTAPKVYLDYDPTRKEGITYLNDDGTGLNTYRLVTTRRYEYRGMTRAAAESAATSLTTGDVTAIAQRADNANSWNVLVVEQTFGPWTTTP